MNDGATRPLKLEDIRPGVVIRHTNRFGDCSPFSDTVVLGDEPSRHGEGGPGWVKLARPYLYASSTETTCPTPLMGAEIYSAHATRLVEDFRLVLTSRGEPYIFISGPFVPEEKVVEETKHRPPPRPGKPILDA